MTELVKPAKSFFSKCDLDLTLIYEVIQRVSSNILTGLYVGFIWLDTVKISSKSDVRLPRYCKFSSGVFFYPPPWFFTCGENLVPMSVNRSFLTACKTIVAAIFETTVTLSLLAHSFKLGSSTACSECTRVTSCFPEFYGLVASHLFFQICIGLLSVKISFIYYHFQSVTVSAAIYISTPISCYLPMRSLRSSSSLSTCVPS